MSKPNGLLSQKLCHSYPGPHIEWHWWGPHIEWLTLFLAS